MTCPNGHRFDMPDSDKAPGRVKCPECDAKVLVKPEDTAATGPVGRGRSLWAVMGQQNDAASESTDEKTEATSPEDSSDPQSSTKDRHAPEKPSTVEPPKPSFVRKTVKPIEAKGDSETEAPQIKRDSDTPGDETSGAGAKESGASEPARPRGLWAMMGSPASPAKDSQSESDDSPTGDSQDDDGDDGQGNETADSEVDSEIVEEREQSPSSELDEGESDFHDGDDDDERSLTDEDEEDGWDVDDPQADLDDLLPPSEPGPAEGPPPGARKGVAALAAGIAATLLGGLTILPWFWVKFPSTVTGVAALVFGYQALGERQRARERKPPFMALAGMLLGLAGMFAGPAMLNDLGRDMRERANAEAVQANLVDIGAALNRYHAEHGRYPAGGEWDDDGTGFETGLHGWMTALLPYLDQSELVGAIDRTKPWNDPVNFPAMSRPVPVFLVPDVEHVPNGQGYATTHYSGVGGEILTDQGRVSLGVFGRDSHVTRFDITDGLSQTMIAGEINRAFPAWGNPGNWRQTGRGLNQEVAGFGNADGTGAHFLMADGSVRFFPNRTSPEVLDRLSTRDAGDNAGLDPVE